MAQVQWLVILDLSSSVTHSRHDSNDSSILFYDIKMDDVEITCCIMCDGNKKMTLIND